MLDAIAIAGQIIVGRELGAGRPERAFDASVRMIALSVVVGAVFALGLLALSDVLPRVFTDDAAVLAQCALLWPIFALMQPLNGAVFALDGILIGAGDGPYIAASMVVAFIACARRADRRGAQRLGRAWRVGRDRRADHGAPRDDGCALRPSTLARHGVGMICA